MNNYYIILRLYYPSLGTIHPSAQNFTVNSQVKQIGCNPISAENETQQMSVNHTKSKLLETKSLIHIFTILNPKKD